MSNYNIKIAMYGSFTGFHFDIVPPFDDGDFGNGHWVFDTLAEAKDEAIRYLDEQHYDEVNNRNDMIKPKSIIRNARLEDTWYDFWDDYKKDQKMLDYLTEKMTQKEYDAMKKEIAKAEGK